MKSLPTLCLVTGNKNKLKEFQQILCSSFIIEAIDIDLPELQGEPEEIAKEKARLAYLQLKRPCIVEDTCLCFNAMDGLPGPYIKWFLNKLGLEGLNKMLVGFEDKTGYAQCTIGYVGGDNESPITFVGKTNGSIVAPRPPLSFGWDPIFLPEGFQHVYSEMEKEQKNKISHRYRAINEMTKYFDHLEGLEKKQKTGEEEN